MLLTFFTRLTSRTNFPEVSPCTPPTSPTWDLSALRLPPRTTPPHVLLSSCSTCNIPTPLTVPSRTSVWRKSRQRLEVICVHSRRYKLPHALDLTSQSHTPRLRMRPSYQLFSSTAKAPTKSIRSQLSRSSKPPLSLEHFLQRQRVLGLYRSIIRSLYRIPKDRRAEPISYAKGEFERNKHVADIGKIRYLVSTGKTEFEGMSRYIDEMAARR